jgi:hypothetical protein
LYPDFLAISSRVLYYSSYGHIEAMASAIADGVRQAGADVVVKRVPELVPRTLVMMPLPSRPAPASREFSIAALGQ